MFLPFWFRALILQVALCAIFIWKQKFPFWQLDNLCKKIQTMDFKWDMDFLSLRPDHVLMGLVIANVHSELERISHAKQTLPNLELLDKMLNLKRDAAAK